MTNGGIQHGTRFRVKSAASFVLVIHPRAPPLEGFYARVHTTFCWIQCWSCKNYLYLCILHTHTHEITHSTRTHTHMHTHVRACAHTHAYMVYMYIYKEVWMDMWKYINE